MTKYDLSELVKSLKTIYFPKFAERLTSIRQYQKVMRGFLREVGRDINKTLLPAYAEAVNEDSEVETAIIVFSVLALIDKLKPTVVDNVRIILNKEHAYLDKKFINAVKTAAKVDVSVLVRSSDMDKIMGQVLERNVSLITSVSDETKRKIEQAVVNARMTKKSQAKLRKELRQILGTQANRADLIASDQLEKMTAEVIRFRMEQAGIYDYEWMTQGDGKVREKHQHLHGTHHNVNNPNHGDDGQLPRQPIRCRCWAKWYLPPKTNETT